MPALRSFRREQIANAVTASIPTPDPATLSRPEQAALAGAADTVHCGLMLPSVMAMTVA